MSNSPQNGFIRPGVISICNRVGFRVDRMSTGLRVSVKVSGEFVDVTLVDHHEELQEEGSCTFRASSVGSWARRLVEFV